MKTETNRETAIRIGTDELLLSRDRRFLIDAIEAALNAERERCAKIARDKWMEMSALGSVESEHYARAGREIAAAIEDSRCPHGIYRHLTDCALCNAAIRGKD